MDEEAFIGSVRKLLRTVGVSSQREIEQAVARAIAAGAVAGNETFPARVTLDIAGLDLHVVVDGEIRLQ
jgi:predicted lactoylglutathione lyase